MPIGGIGTGTVSLGGRGDLRDWEIVNRPAKGFKPRHAFLAIRAADDTGNAPFVRCLEGPLTSGFDAAHGTSVANGGLPRFTNATFLAAYPLAQVVLNDDDAPIDVRIEAFNPMVPGDASASGLPVACIRVVVRNRTANPLSISVAASLENFIGRDGKHGESVGNVNEGFAQSGLAGITMRSRGVDPGGERAGTIALATLDHPRGTVTVREDWAHATWAGGLLDFWDDFTADGALDDREQSGETTPIGSVCHQVPLAPGAQVELTFLLAWHFPNRMSWDVADPAAPPPTPVGNWYATQDDDAVAVVARTAPQLPELERRTVQFVSAFCATPVPAVVKEAALFNTSTLRTQTAFRTSDGHFFGWEGCHDDNGCCHGSCTHVWNYEQATAHLYGDLARSMREVEFLHATNARGLMSFRVNLPLSLGTTHGVAAADGQMGCLMKLYREWRLSGDDNWLRTLWPHARRALEFCWEPGGWDADRDGVMEGCQHNTMDVEYFGPNPEIEFWYLGALRAGEEMARQVGDAAFADELRSIFESGSAWTDAHLFNGEYYEHRVQPARSRARVAAGLAHHDLTDEDLDTPPLQIGAGCLVDQLVGQAFAGVVGLGDLGDRGHIERTLRSIVQHNQRHSLGPQFNPMRTYAAGDEAGTILCTYPRGNRPTRPVPYFAEVWTGLEYTLATHQIQVGQVREGITTIELIRSRYDGARRNPFDEAECGHHYARAMSSWGAYLAMTCFGYDARSGELSLSLVDGAAPTFWSTGHAWGTAALNDGRVTVEVTEGTIRLDIVRINGEARIAPNAGLWIGPATATI
jgi:uncharacterized protein (DUF608 family)